MSTQHATPDKVVSPTDHFEPAGEPRPLSTDDLAACRQPQRNLFEEARADERVAFAVAVRPGHLVVDTPSVDSDIEANAVLYLTRDGEFAVERHVTGATGDLGLVPRAIVAATAALEPADAAAKRFGPVVRRHPEV